MNIFLTFIKNWNSFRRKDKGPRAAPIGDRAPHQQVYTHEHRQKDKKVYIAWQGGSLEKFFD